MAEEEQLTIGSKDHATTEGYVYQIARFKEKFRRTNAIRRFEQWPNL